MQCCGVLEVFFLCGSARRTCSSCRTRSSSSWLVRVGVVELFFFVPNPFLVVRFFIQAANVEAGCFMALRFQTAGFVQPVGLLGLACVACSTCS